MDFKLNPLALGVSVSVPASIIDENLKLANGIRLKTILYFTRASFSGVAPTVSEVARAIGADEEDCEDALIFWRERGIVLSSSDEIGVPKTNSIVPKHKENDGKTDNKSDKSSKKEEIPFVKPSAEQVAVRLEESPEMAYLCNETQKIIGKTFGYSDRATLLMLHDYYGIPFEVILMLVRHCKMINRTAINQIATLGKIWAEREIFSVELAEAYISAQSQVFDLWKKFRSETRIKNEIPTTNQKEYFLKWTNVFKMSLELIVLAYEITIEQTGKFVLKYADKILRNWSTSGFSTVEDVKAAEEQKQNNFKQNNSNQKGGKKDEVFSSDGASYNTDNFSNLGFNIKKI